MLRVNQQKASLSLKPQSQDEKEARLAAAPNENEAWRDWICLRRAEESDEERGRGSRHF